MYKYNCPDPWLGMCVSFNGNVSVNCCQYQFSGMRWEPGSRLDLLAYWQDPWFSKLRETLRSGKLKGSGCNLCISSKALLDPTSPEIPEGLNTKQYDNYNKALESYAKRELEVEHYPCTYIFDFGRQCNLNCIMCTQTDVRRQHKRDNQLSAERLMEQADVISHASKVLFFGGEPLFIPESRKFLDHMLTDPRLLDVEAEMVTNGQLLGDFLPKFPNKDRMHLIVSLDSIGEQHERIRKGGKWSRVSNNIDEFVRLRELHSKKHWTLLVSSVLMKTSLKVVDEFVQWVVDRDADMIFYPMFQTRYNGDEDVLRNPALLKEVGDWEGKLERSVDILDKAGKTREREELQSYLDRLRKAARIGGESKACGEAYDEALSDIELSGKRVAIWGTGSYYKITFAKWLEGNIDDFEFLGFIDNNSSIWGDKLDGYDIHSPEMLKEQDVDVVIIATVYKSQIADQVRRMGVENVQFA